MTPPSSWPAKFSLLVLALALHSISGVHADGHLKPRSVWSRRHRDIQVVRRQTTPGDALAKLVGDPISVEPNGTPTSNSTSNSTSTSSSDPGVDSILSQLLSVLTDSPGSPPNAVPDSPTTTSTSPEPSTSNDSSPTSPPAASDPTSVPPSSDSTGSTVIPPKDPTNPAVPSENSKDSTVVPSNNSTDSNVAPSDSVVPPAVTQDSAGLPVVPLNSTEHTLAPSDSSESIVPPAVLLNLTDSTVPSTPKDPTTVSSDPKNPTTVPSNPKDSTVVPPTSINSENDVLSSIIDALSSIVDPPSSSDSPSPKTDLPIQPNPLINLPVTDPVPKTDSVPTTDPVPVPTDAVPSTDKAPKSDPVTDLLGNPAKPDPLTVDVLTVLSPPTSDGVFAEPTAVPTLGQTAEPPKQPLPFDFPATPATPNLPLITDGVFTEPTAVPNIGPTAELPNQSSPIVSFDLPGTAATPNQPLISVDVPPTSDGVFAEPTAVPTLGQTAEPPKQPIVSFDFPATPATPNLPLITDGVFTEPTAVPNKGPTAELPNQSSPIVSFDLPATPATPNLPPTNLPQTNDGVITEPTAMPTGGQTSEPPNQSPAVPTSSPNAVPTADPTAQPPPKDPLVSPDTNAPAKTSSGVLSLDMSSFLPGSPNTIETEYAHTISSSESISISIRPEFSYLTASWLDIQPTPTTSTSVTITNPDAPPTAVSPATQTGGVATDGVSSVPIPTNIPQFIKPSDQSDPVDLNSNPPGYTLISILFQQEVGWTKVLSTSDIAGAMMAYIPGLVTAILNVPDTDVKLVGLKAHPGADYQTSRDPKDIQTMLVFYLVTDQVPTLKSYIATSGSSFYTSGNAVTKQLTALVVKSYPIAPPLDTHSGTQNSADNSTISTADNTRRNAIIGVSVAFGTIALGVFIWWAVKTYQQRREKAHRRLTHQPAPNYGATGAPRMMAERGNNSNNNSNNGSDGGVGRRNSFYAFGQNNDSVEDETFDYISQHSQSGSGPQSQGVRRPVAGQPISQPILRETSMGHW